jgi:hypothetical protein
MTNSVLIENTTPDELSKVFRQIVREELTNFAPANSGPKYLTRYEVVELLKISLPTLNEYTRKGLLIGKRIGTRILYLESDIQEAVKDIPTLKYSRINFPRRRVAL